MEASRQHHGHTTSKAPPPVPPNGLSFAHKSGRACASPFGEADNLQACLAIDLPDEPRRPREREPERRREPQQSDQERIIGSWAGEMAVQGVRMRVELTVNRDQTFRLRAHRNGGRARASMGADLILSGRLRLVTSDSIMMLHDYKFEGDTLRTKAIGSDTWMILTRKR